MGKFRGLGTALITPFKKGGEVDYKSLDKIIEFQLSCSVDYLVMLGTTGEGVTVEDDEAFSILDHVIKKVNKRAGVVAGCSSNNTSSLVKKVEKMNSLDLDAYLSVTPYYNKPTQEGVYLHYKELAKAAGKRDIILYNVPGRTASWIMPETIVRLLGEYKNIVAIKEASGDLNFSMEILRKLSAVSNDFTFLSGEDSLTLPMICLGYHGVISVVSNEIPAQMKNMVDLANAGNFKEAARVHYEILDLMKANFIESNPIPVKYAMKKLNYCDGSLRLPLSEMKNTEKMDEILKSYT